MINDNKAILPLESTKPTVYRYFSNYSFEDETEAASVDALWSEIIPEHGIVALNHEWARSQHLPPAISLPSDHSKGIYAIDAYHQLHCLVRRTYLH